MHRISFVRRRNRALAPAAALLLALCLLAVGVQALTDSPALVINEPGRYTLDHDLSSDSSIGVLINSSDVVFDGMGHSITGTGNGTGVLASGTDDPISGDTIANVTVRNLTVRHWSTGIFGGWLTDSVVEDVVAEQNGVGLGHGAFTGGWSTQALVRDSVFRNNTGAGIYLDYPAEGIAIERCQVTGNGDGLVTFDSGRFDAAANRIDGCDFSGNAGFGLSISEGHFSGVGNSTISGNGGDGVRIVKSYTTFSGNRIENNGGTGVDAGDRSSSTITGNRIEGNGVGVRTDSEFGFGIWNNVLNNTVNGYISNSAGSGRLNVSKTAGPNIIGGPFIGGNVWAFPNGTGFSQTHPDTDGDGFCDEAYFLNEDTSDALPLALPNVTPIGGDTGYFLVSTVPSGAAISLVDISGTAYPVGTTSAGPLNVTIHLTATPMRAIVANLSGYRDAVYNITQYPAKGETVPVTLTLEPVGPQPYRPLSVPGKIQAEDYNLGGEGVAYHDTTPGNTGGAYRNDDVDIETGNGVTDVGWIRNSEYLTYTVNVTQTGDYLVSARVASPNNGRSIVLFVDGTSALTVWVPNTGSFDRYVTTQPYQPENGFAPIVTATQTPTPQDTGHDVMVPVRIPLTAGTHVLKLAFAGDGQNIDWFELVPIVTPTPTPTPVGPQPYKPLAIPGTIQAEDYNLGGEGIAYHDTTPGNEGGAYRHDDVDIETANGITDVGWIRQGEYLTYTANVTRAGNYTISARVASPNIGRLVAITVDGAQERQVEVPNTGSFDQYRNVTARSYTSGGSVTPGPTVTTAPLDYWVALSAGNHTVKLAFMGDGQNVDWIAFEPYVPPTPTPTPVGPQPFKPLSIPGTIQAEDYNLGGEGVAYHDTTPGNEGGEYRHDDVDIETVGGVTDVGWIRNGEYLTYTANVTAGNYTLSARVASPNSGRTFAVSVDGTPLATVAVPNTGAFERWTTTARIPVALGAGNHTVKLAFSGDGQNLDWIAFEPSTPPTVTATPTPTPEPGSANFTAAPLSAPKGSAVRFTLTPAAGKTVSAAWWSFDAPAHLNTWNSRAISPTFFYPAAGTFSPLVKITYADGTTETVQRANYVRAT